MRSFLLTRRLRWLSRALIRYRSSGSDNFQTKDDLFQARLLLYSDMLQYHEDHPDDRYRDICRHFVDDSTLEILVQQRRRSILLGISFLCIVIVIVGLFSLEWIAAYILKNIPTSFHKV